MGDSELIGFVRKSKAGNALNISISAEAIAKAQTYTSKNEEEYIGLVINLKNLQKVIAGEKEVTSISQMTK